MAGSMSIWTVDERLLRFKKVVSEERLNKLKSKRVRQTTRLIEKYFDNVVLRNKFQTKLAYLT